MAKIYIQDYILEMIVMTGYVNEILRNIKIIIMNEINFDSQGK